MSNLTTLRSYLKEHQLSGFIVPRTDEYQSEYLAPYAERVAWVSGFTGSAGLVIVTLDKAVIFVDGRYTIQVRQQTDNGVFEYGSLSDKAIQRWLMDNMHSGEKLAYDAALHTHKNLDLFADSCQSIEVELISQTVNPVDLCWQDQPDRPSSMANAYPLEYSGESSVSKRQRIGKQLADESVAALVTTMPDCIAWVLNVRGNDTPCVPVVLSNAIIYADGRIEWCIDPKRVDFSLNDHCGENVYFISEKEFESQLVNMAKTDVKVMIDKATIPVKYFNLLNENNADLVFGNPLFEAKSCKNTVELANSHATHIRDGVALISFLAWLETAVETSSVSELSAMDKLLSFRQQQPLYQESSFTTISGFAGNGAIVHYTSTPETNKNLQKNGLFLLDSGGQYFGGTTDVTRTVVIGVPTNEQKDRFTRVLKGHIALGTCRFPEGTSGHQLDAMARRALWDIGLDYAHGTGHGVGSYLGVHEGPQRISAAVNDTPLKSGMIVSNEPGYYKESEFGIRIENLVTVKKSEKFNGFLEFENLTMVPIDRNLIDVVLLSSEEIDWINSYHKEVYEKISPNLEDTNTIEWLKRATCPM